MSQVQSVRWIVQQAMVEIGLGKPGSVVANEDAIVQQMVALLNACGQEMILGYPWEQLNKEWILTTVGGQDEYDLPSDWGYFLDQTQWDRTNHWPLMGPKSPQEWQWLKGGLLSSGPRTRYRVWKGKFVIFPAPAVDATPTTIAMEYIADTWLADAGLANTYYAQITDDTNLCLLDPWVMVKFLKLKFYEAKGLDAAAFSKDFVGTFQSRVGKNKGAPILSLAPRNAAMLLGVNNIPDGSWPVGSTG